MRKNVAGQHVAGQMNSRTDGSPLTASVSVLVTIDNGTQTAGGGTTTHKGNGHWNYAPTQAETNGNHLAFTFTHATGVNQTVNVYTVSYDPHNTTTLGLTNLDAAVSSRMATYTQPTGFLAATFPTTVASTTNITAGTITTTTNLTNLPSIPTNWITAAGITAAALNGKGDWNIGKTGYSLTATTGLGNQTANITGNLSGSVGSVTGAVTVGTNSDKTGYSISGTKTTLDALNDITAASVWAVNGALGKTYGLMASENNAAQIIRVAQFQAGSTAQTLVLDTGASATDDFYNRTTVTIATGTGAGQNRLINDYVGSTRTAYLDRPLIGTPPASGDYFAIDSRGNSRSASDLRIGLAQAGAASTITLQADESASDDFYNRMFILIESGTGNGQARLIDDYVGTTKVATVARPWVVQPDNTSRYVILPFGSVKVSDIDADAVNAAALSADAVAELADAVWDEILSGHLGAGSTGAALNAAGGSGDPWSTVLPGAYGAGTAGNIIGNNINAPIATVDTVVDAIKAKTDQLTFTKANELDSNIQSVNDVTIVGNGSGTPFNV